MDRATVRLSFIGVLMAVILIAILGVVAVWGFGASADTALADAHTHDGYTAWTATDSLPDSAGSYYLTADVTLGGTWYVPSGETNLCLNGHGIKKSGGTVINVGGGNTLNVYDCGTTEHKFSISDSKPNGAGLATVNDALTGTEGTDYFTFNGGYITGGNAGDGGGLYVYGTVNFYGGSIMGNTGSTNGGGVKTDGSGHFNMYGGSIQYNHGNTGGGVFVESGSTFTLIGGSIAHNKSSIRAGAIFDRGQVYIRGGEIVNNYNQYEKANINMWGGAIEITGGTIRDNLGTATHMSGIEFSTMSLGGDVVFVSNADTSGNNANLYMYNGGVINIVSALGDVVKSNKIGITMQSDKGEFTSGWATYMGDTDPADYFYSENADYEVLRIRGEARLVKEPYTLISFAGGDAGVTGYMETDILEDGATSFTLPAETTFKLAGKALAGWRLGETVYNPGQTVTLGGDDVTFTAVWTDGVTVTFDSKGGTSFDSKCILPSTAVANPGKPTKAGYTFLYWMLDGAEYDFATPVTQDITLKALWAQGVGVGESFESGALPDGWTTSGDYSWGVGTGDYEDETGAHTGAKNVKAANDGNGGEAWLILPEMDLSGVVAVPISFWYINRSWSGDIDEFGIYYRVNGGGWVVIDATGDNHDSWTEWTGELPSAALTAGAEIGFRAADHYGYGAAIDDIVIEAITPHTHEWSYTASGNVITATCGGMTDGTCPLEAQTVTITAEDKDYDGTPVAATVTKSAKWDAYGLASVGDVSYSGNTIAGDYTASITVGGATAVANFTIASVAPHEHDDITFAPWTATDSLPTEGNYYLITDVTVSATTTVSGTLNLCLNGYGVKKTGSGSVFTVGNGKKLNIYDCGTTTHYFDLDANHRAIDINNASGTYSFTGGYIAGGNVTADGGCVTVSGGEMTLYGGTICGNQAIGSSSDGIKAGAIYLKNSAKFTMTGGAISYNYSAKQGGAICTDESAVIVIISGGEIKGNKAIQWGSAIWAGRADNSRLEICGTAKIIDNISNEEASINLAGTRNYIISGDPTIEGKTENSSKMLNAHINMDSSWGSLTQLLELSAPLTNDTGEPKITISAIGSDLSAGNTIVFTKNWSTYMGNADPSKYFKLDASVTGSKVVRKNGEAAVAPSGDKYITFDANGGLGSMDSQLVTGASANLNANTFSRTGFAFFGWNTKADGTGTAYSGGANITVAEDVTLYAQWAQVHNDITFAPWVATNSLPTEAGNYYLIADVTIGSTWSVPAGETNLCLNGHGIKTTSGRAISVGSGVTLNLYDCDDATEHNYTLVRDYDTVSGAGLATVDDSLTENYKTFVGGYITGGVVAGRGGGIYVEGTLNMRGGTIIGNKAYEGGGLLVLAGGHANLEGVAILGNITYGGGGGGGGVHLNGTAIITLTDCSIQYNRAKSNGGGISQSGSGTLTINGGEIKNNESRDNDSSGFKGGAIALGGSVWISGDLVVSDNYNYYNSTSTLSNILDGGSGKIIVAGALGENASIGVGKTTNKGVYIVGTFTNGWSTYMNGDDPADYFVSDKNSCVIGLDGDEVAVLYPMEATAQGYSGTYDGLAHGIAVDAIDGTTIRYGTAADACTLSALEYADAGTYTVYYLVTKSGYKSVQGSATVAIGVKTITVTANPKSKTYGEADPDMTYEVEGLVIGDSVTGALTREAGENVGTYTILQGTLSADDNYIIAYTGAKLTINQKTLTVTADTKAKTYGDADPAFTYDVEGLVGTNALSGALTREAGENVGTYAIGVGTLSAGDNYTIDYTSANLTINTKTLTITANAQSRNYGAADPALTYVVEGLVGEDTTSGALTREAGENVGTYAILQGSLTAGGNYIIAYTGANFVILPIDVTVTITGNHVTVDYDGEEHTVSGYEVSIGNELYKQADFTFDGTASAILTNAGTAYMGLASNQFANTSANFATVTFNVTDGYVTVAPIDVTVTITGHNDTVPYDGEAHEVKGYDVVIGNDLYNIIDFAFGGEAKATLTNAGTAYMGLNAAQFGNTNANFANVTFVVTDGYITVAPIDVSVTITGKYSTVPYDGETHSVSGYDVAFGNALYTANDFTFGGTADATQTNAGTAYMNLASSQFANTNANFANVTFDVTDGYVIVNPIDVTVTIAGHTATFDYDGEAHTVSGYDVTFGNALYTAADYIFDGADSATLTNAGTANMGLAASQFANTNANFANVTFDVTDGYVTVNPIDVTVTIAGHTATFDYDGAAHTVNGYDVTFGNALYTAADYIFDGADSATLTNAGTANMGLAASQFANTNANFATVTFDVTDGYVTVNPIDVTVTITGHTDTVAYDGEAHEVEGYDVAFDTDLYTAEDFTFDAEATVTLANAGTVYMGLDAEQFANVNANFATVTFVVEDGYLTITTVDAVVLTAPVTLDPIEDGTATALVAAGTALGGEVLYALGDEQTAPETDAFLADIPTATEIGNYYVWYYVAADANHNNSAPACVKVTLAEPAWVELKGVVSKGGEPAGGATVTLKKGNQTVDAVVVEEDGAYRFIVPIGVYSVVVEKAGNTETTSVSLFADEEKDVAMADGKTESKLEVVAEEDLGVAVSGLEQEAQDIRTENLEAASVSVQMTVEPKTEQTAANAEPIVLAIANKSFAFLDIKVERTVDEVTSTLASTANVMEIAIPYAKVNKRGLVVYSYHDDSVRTYVARADRPTAEDINAADGTFYADKANGYVYIYTKNFSTYAIAYTPYYRVDTAVSLGKYEGTVDVTLTGQDNDCTYTLEDVEAAAIRFADVQMGTYTMTVTWVDGATNTLTTTVSVGPKGVTFLAVPTVSEPEVAEAAEPPVQDEPADLPQKAETETAVPVQSTDDETKRREEQED